MDNPYQTPSSVVGYATAAPKWYLLFHQLYWPVWIIGTALIAGSWMKVVTPEVGWIGFAIAGTAALLSYVLPSFVGIKSPNHVVLDSLQLKMRGAEYHDAMRRFEHGATLMFDGLTFGFRRDNSIACAVVADSGDIEEVKAIEIANHAQEAFNRLVSESTEFASAVAGRTFCISIMANRAAGFRDLCEVVDGKIEWKR